MARRRSAVWASAEEPGKLHCIELHGWHVCTRNPRIFCECFAAPLREVISSMPDRNPHVEWRYRRRTHRLSTARLEARGGSGNRFGGSKAETHLGNIDAVRRSERIISYEATEGILAKEKQ